MEETKLSELVILDTIASKLVRRSRPQAGHCNGLIAEVVVSGEVNQNPGSVDGNKCILALEKP